MKSHFKLKSQSESSQNSIKKIYYHSMNIFVTNKFSLYTGFFIMYNSGVLSMVKLPAKYAISLFSYPLPFFRYLKSYKYSTSARIKNTNINIWQTRLFSQGQVLFLFQYKLLIIPMQEVSLFFCRVS